MHHIECICMEDNKRQSLSYGFWLGDIFEHFGVPVPKWQEQTKKDVLGTVNEGFMPSLEKGDPVSVQRLSAQLATKDDEISALKASHSADMEQLKVSYDLKYVGLEK